MVDRKIIDLPVASAVTGDDLLLIVDGPAGTGTNRKLTVQTLLSNLHGRGAIAARPSADISNFGMYFFATDEGIFYQSDGVAWSAIAKLTLTPSDIPSGIDAAKIGAGAVDSATFGYLSNVTSDLQTQLNNKQPLNANLTTLSSLGTALQQIRVNPGATGLEYFSPSSSGVAPLIPPSVCDGRLTLASGTPDTSGTNIIGATTIFFTPYLGNLIALYNTAEARWELHSFSELSLPLAGTAANTNYDVFIWDNAGTLTLEWVAWASSGAGTSTRATAITRLNGTWVKSTDNRRYLGSFRTTSAGQTEDSETGTPKCFLQNCSNRVVRTLSRNDATASWTYSGTSFRATNNSTLNRVEVINGSESMIKASYYQLISSGLDYRVGIGVNSTTETSSLISPLMFNSAASSPVQGTTVFEGALSTGFNYLQMLERAVSGSGIVYGTIALGRSGMIVDYWA